jgi:hypothetical protein
MKKEKYGGYPVLFGAQVTQTSSKPLHQPGAVFMWRKGTGNAYAGIVQYVQLDNNGCSYGQALIANPATISGYSVMITDLCSTFGKSPNFVGIAAATIASQYYGFMVIGGYCECAYCASAAASGNVLGLAATATGMLTPAEVATVWAATESGTGDFSGVMGVAVARGAITAAAMGSVTLCGHWGI